MLRIQIIIGTISVLLLIIVFELIRRRKLKEEYSLLWLLSRCARTSLGHASFSGSQPSGRSTHGLPHHQIVRLPEEALALPPASAMIAREHEMQERSA